MDLEDLLGRIFVRKGIVHTATTSGEFGGKPGGA